MKIRTKLGIIPIIFTIILIVALFITQKISHRTIRSQVGNHLLTTAQSRAYNIETLLNDYKEIVQILAVGIPFTNVLDPTIDYEERMTECDLRIKRSIEINPHISRIKILDKNGIVICSSHNDVGFDQSTENIFLKGKENVYFGKIHRSEYTKNLVLSISAPIFVRDKLSGIVIINFDVEKKFYEIVTDKTGLGKTGEIYLINKEGYIITPSRFMDNIILHTKINTEQVNSFISEHIEKDIISEMLEKPTTYVDFRGEKVLGTLYYISELQWGLIAEIDVEEANKPISKMTFLLIAIFSFFIIITVIFAVIIFRSITLPIKNLHKGTEVIINGNFDHKFDNETEDEIGQLSRAFDIMTDKLTESQKELKEYTKQLDIKVKDRTAELEKQFEKSEKQRIATLSVLADLNKTTVNLKAEITERKRNEQIQNIIHNISNAVAISDNPEEFVVMVKNELGTIIDTSNFFVALYDEPTDSISLLYHNDKKDKIKTFPAGNTLTKYVIKTKKSLLATKEVKDKLEKSGEVELLGADSKIWLGVPLFAKGKVSGVIVVQSYEDEKAYNKSDMRTLEIISHQISISLERKKAEEDLKIALEKAQQSDRLKTAFLHNMSHEIRTPLNGITGFIGLLQDSEIEDDEKQDYFDIINKSSNRLITTVTDIIDISRIEAGEVKVSKTEVSVNKILEEQYEFFYQEAKSKGLELNYKTSLTDNESRIITDKHKLEGILTNLIKNAIKFTEAGSITFGYTTKNLEGKEIFEFYVKDTGIGIPEDRLDAIFNRFEQADLEDTRAFEGSGLGLAISKSYVEMLGGEIGVSSKKGSGSTFTFSIPFAKQIKKKSGTVASGNKVQQSSLGNLSVIVAEDDGASKILFEKIFKNKFHKIIYTKTGGETIEVLKKHPETDIILMDIKMPGMSGYTATREIRKFNKDVVIIAQTAYGLAGDKEKALEAGCDDYISKPIKNEILFEKIRDCLDKKSI